MSKTAKSIQSYGNSHMPYHCSGYFLARALVYDVACEFACAVTMRRNNWRERPEAPAKRSQHVVCIWPLFCDVMKHVGCCWLLTKLKDQCDFGFVFVQRLLVQHGNTPVLVLTVSDLVSHLGCCLKENNGQ